MLYGLFENKDHGITDFIFNFFICIFLKIMHSVWKYKGMVKIAYSIKINIISEKINLNCEGK